MDKIIHLESHFPTGELTVQPVLLWANGRACYEEVTKYASVGHEFFKTVTPVPGHSFVYVLAVSGWEFYGVNRNGDAFPEFPYMETASPPWIAADETLPHYYKTFEQFGMNYRHHCFPAGMPVTMADRTRRPIEEIEVGDLVDTLAGDKKVIKTFKRKYKGDGIKLRLRGNYEDLVGTADHPVLVYRRDQIHCPHKYNYLSQGKGCAIKQCIEHGPNIGEPEWAALSTILPGDYLVSPRPKHGEKEVPPSFAKLVGWTASEGYLGDRGAIKFTFGETADEDIEAVTTCLEARKVHVTVSRQPQYQRVCLAACSQDLHSMLSRYVMGTFADKTLTPNIFEWDTNALLHFLGAYIDGDGCVTKNKAHYGQLLIRSSSPQMLNMLSDIIRSLGTITTIHWDTPAGWMLSPTNYEYYRTNGSGVVSVEPLLAASVTEYSRKKLEVPIGQRHGQINHPAGIFLTQVIDREDIELDEDVFNLEVEDVHHYVVSGVVVHNCNKDPEKAVGKVVKAFWNSAMHRVELLIDLENAKAPDLAERILSGEYPPVSMGCRVAFDRCNICGNAAPTRAQYCNHLRFQMKEIINGKQICALNPRPKFFDISWVYRGADANAFMMKKVAEARPYEITGAEAGEYLNKVSAFKDAAHKLAVIDKLIQGIPLGAREAGMDPTELQNMQRCVPLAAELGRAAVDLPNEMLQGMSQFSIPQVFSTMAARGMAPTTPEVVKITIIKVYKQLPSPEILDKSVALQHGIFELLEDHPQIIQQLMDSGALSLGSQQVHPGLFDALAPLMEKRSGIGEYLKRRIVPENWRDESPYTSQMTLTDPATGQGYATTRGAAIAAHDEIAKRNLYKVLGGTALLGAGYKVVGHMLGPGRAWMKPLTAAGLGALGLANLPSMGPHYMTDQGVPIPVNTELAKMSSIGGYALPAVGTLGLMALLGQDYNSRMQDGIPLGHPGLPVTRRGLDWLEENVHEHPLISAGVGALGLHMLGRSPLGQWGHKRLVNPLLDIGGDIAGKTKGMFNRVVHGETKLSAYLGRDIPIPMDTVLLPEIDLDRLAEKIGELIVEG